MIPNRTKGEILKGNIDLVNDTIKVALLKNTTEYSEDPDSHNFVSDVLDGGTTGEEYDDSGYSRQALSSQAVNTDDTNDQSEFDASDTTFSSIGSATGGQVVEAILVYKQVGADDTTPGDDPIIAVYDDSNVSDLEKQTNGEDFTIQWDAEGLLKIA